MILSAGAGLERGTCLNDDGLGDVDAEGARALASGPHEDACVLGFVPEIGLQNLQVLERGEVLGEQTPFVVGVISGRRCAVEIRKSLADSGPEIPVRGPQSSTRRSWRHRSTPATSQL